EDNVPREAITMGVATILQAREIALIATGEHKADVVRRAVEGEPSPDVAATFLQGHSNAAAYLDLAAAAELTRIKTPCLLVPDDDVISMGGMLRKLWENENAIVVAYMTSGNIAVFDHDVQRQLDFVERAAETLGIDRAAVRRVRDAVEASFEHKGPGGIDLPVVQDL